MAIAQDDITDALLTGQFADVDVEAPSVIQPREAVAARLVGPACVVVVQVVADRGFDLALGRIQPEAEDARADRRVEPPRLDVDGSALAEKWRGVAVGADAERGGAEVGDRWVGGRSQDLARDRRLVAGR